MSEAGRKYAARFSLPARFVGPRLAVWAGPVGPGHGFQEQYVASRMREHISIDGVSEDREAMAPLRHRQDTPGIDTLDVVTDVAGASGGTD